MKAESFKRVTVIIEDGTYTTTYRAHKAMNVSFLQLPDRDREEDYLNPTRLFVPKFIDFGLNFRALAVEDDSVEKYGEILRITTEDRDDVVAEQALSYQSAETPPESAVETVARILRAEACEAPIDVWDDPEANMAESVKDVWREKARKLLAAAIPGRKW